MARPTSKYFTPVIKKILEAKKAENIVVDQEFKNVLRAQMLSKISAAPIRKEVYETLPERRSAFDFTEFFNKFRYPLAIVPSMLLLVVVAMSAMKLPVSIKNEVIVPTPTPATSNNSSVQSSTVDTSSSDYGDVQKLKTFSGSSVLPSSYRNGSASNTAPEVISNPQLSNLDFDLNDSVSSQPSSVKQNVVVVQQPEQNVPVQQDQPVSNQEANPFNFMVQSFIESENQRRAENNENNNSDSTVDTDTSLQLEPTVNSTALSNVSAVEQAPVVQQQSKTFAPEAVTQPALVVQPSVLDQQTNVADTNVSQKLQLNDVQPQIDIQAQPLETVSQPLETANKQLNVNTINMAQPVLQAPVETLSLEPQYTVYYTADISEREKAAFETEALAAVGGKEITFMYVSEGTDSNVVEVSYTFADGSTATKLFKNIDGSWHLAQYVQRYFYDTGLQYQISN